jgi:serine/threonine-protein kinase
MQVRLTVIEGPHQGQEFRLTDNDRFLVGRSKTAHFRLKKVEDKDHCVSRRHFLIEVIPPLCRIHDLRSRNGTFVNGVSVETADLKHGDEIKAGHTVMRLTVEETPAEPTEAWEEPPHPLTPPKPPARRLPSRALAPDACTVRGACVERDRPLCDPCRRLAESQPQPVPGYLLLRELGKGAMGVVHLALCEADAALIAVKRITPVGVVRPRQVERFLREARILSELRHDNIVAFRDMGEAGGSLWFAMEYVPGTDAAQLLKRKGPMSVRKAVRLVCQLLKGLEYAHQTRIGHRKGIVHRDVKPANLLLKTDKKPYCVKVADFGLAREYQASRLSGLTLENSWGGTVEFMPPEQITDFRNVRPEADQYSAAATLYNLLTGKFVHDQRGNLGERLDRILHEDPVPIQSYLPNLPHDLAVAIHHAMGRDPERRYPDVGYFRDAIKEYGRRR